MRRLRSAGHHHVLGQTGFGQGDDGRTADSAPGPCDVVAGRGYNACAGLDLIAMRGGWATSRQSGTPRCGGRSISPFDVSNTSRGSKADSKNFGRLQRVAIKSLETILHPSYSEMPGIGMRI